MARSNTAKKLPPSGKARLRAVSTMADGADKYALYRLSVQDPEHEAQMFVQFFKDEYKRAPLTLREDFCAAAAICAEWVRRGKDRRAVGVDLDPEPLAYGKKHYLSTLDDEQRARVRLLQENVLSCSEPADVIAAQNFSFFIFKDRPTLLAYFRAVHACLNDEGVFVIDMFGGGSVHDEQIEESRQVARPTAEDKKNHPPFRYVWAEESFNPITHDALFHIHFRFPDGSALDKAFTYDWRLWTLPEIRDLLAEAGFSASHVYFETEDENGDGTGKYRRARTARPHRSWLAYIIGIK